MEMDNRPDPDRLLKQVESEEQNRKKGKLKIFFGYAAGVGKTYAMLQAARPRRKEPIPWQDMWNLMPARRQLLSWTGLKCFLSEKFHIKISC